MKCSVSNIAWRPEERLEAYRALERAGSTGLEIAPGLFFHSADDPFSPDAANAKQAIAEAEAAGLLLVSMQSLLFGVPGASLFDGAEARSAFEYGMVRAIQLAGRFGIPNCVFGSPAQRRVPAGMAMNQALDQAAEVFARLGEIAKAEGTAIAIEANPEAYGTNFLTNLGDALAFVERVDHPAIVAILDLGAMHLNGEFATTPDQVRGLTPRLNHVHISEPYLACAPDPETDLTPVLDALTAEGYSRAVSIEMKRPVEGIPGVEAAAGRLRAAIESLEAKDA